VIYNLIGRATVKYLRFYLERRVPSSGLLVAVAAAAGILILVGGAAALSANSKSDPDY
jgi:hypothetical protein